MVTLRASVSLLGTAVFLISACDRAGTSGSAGGEVSRSWNPLAVKKVKGVPVDAFQAELKRLLASKPDAFTDEQWQHTRRLYAAYGDAPLWLDDDGLIDKRGRTMTDALVNATTDGLDLDKYPLLETAAAIAQLEKNDHPTAQQLARADLLLTASFAAMGEDYLTGQIDPKTVSQSWYMNREENGVDSALVRSLRDKELADALARMRPQDADYDRLRQKLIDYRKIVSAGGWPRVPAGKPLKRGESDSPARLQALRSRLKAEGYAVPDSGATFDASLAGAIAQFQARHTIVVDSMLGKETLDALNVPADYRLAQIAANLERYRWLPRTMGDRYIFVNVPAFRLQAFDSGRKVLEMKVIVGAEYDGRDTPVFSDKMEFVVFRPYWNVTDKIAENELFPKLAAGTLGPSYETYTENGKLRIRQKPGEKNSLGLIKFMFPNDFNIYLHDTPQDELFDKDVRAFSHGCIRLEKPEELAEWVLGWPLGKVQQAEHGPDNRQVNLPRKIPVYIAYFTAFVRDGQLWFGNDLYQRDEALARATLGGAMPSGVAVRGVTALRQLTD